MPDTVSEVSPPTLPPDTTVGPVELTVSDLERSRSYYEQVVGLRVLEHGGSRMSLGTDGTELLVLVEEPGARPAVGHTGLFHFALLVPDRPSLARWLAHAGRDRVPLTGLSDHFVSEAIYLSDPDRHGIEIYADRPRQVWEGQVEARPDDRFRSTSTRCSQSSRIQRSSRSRGFLRGRRWVMSTSAWPRSPRRSSSIATCSGSSSWRPTARRRRSWPRAATTTTSAPTRGRAAGHLHRRPGPPRSVRRRSSSRTPPSATGWPAESPMRGRSPSPGPDGVTVHDPSGNRLLLAAR